MISRSPQILWRAIDFVFPATAHQGRGDRRSAFGSGFFQSTGGSANPRRGCPQKLYDDNQKRSTLVKKVSIRLCGPSATGHQRQQGAGRAHRRRREIPDGAFAAPGSRDGLASMAVMDAHVVTTDPMRIPDVEAVVLFVTLMVAAWPTWLDPA